MELVQVSLIFIFALVSGVVNLNNSKDTHPTVAIAYNLQDWGEISFAMEEYVVHLYGFRIILRISIDFVLFIIFNENDKSVLKSNIICVKN